MQLCSPPTHSTQLNFPMGMHILIDIMIMYLAQSSPHESLNSTHPQHSRSVSHEAGLVQSRLAVSQHEVPVSQVSVHNLAVARGQTPPAPPGPPTQGGTGFGHQLLCHTLPPLHRIGLYLNVMYSLGLKFEVGFLIL